MDHQSQLSNFHYPLKHLIKFRITINITKIKQLFKVIGGVSGLKVEKAVILEKTSSNYANYADFANIYENKLEACLTE